MMRTIGLAAVVLLLGGSATLAQNAVQMGKIKTTFQGTFKSTAINKVTGKEKPLLGVDIEVTNYYVQTTKCNLVGNDYINDDGQLVTKQTVHTSRSSYSLKVADTASMGRCEFRLDSIYLTVGKNNVLVPINFRTASYIKAMNAALAADGLQGDKLISKMQPSITFDCPFSYNGVSCSMEKSLGDLFEFGIKANGETYTMNFIDRKKPNFQEDYPVYPGVDIALQQ